MEILSCASVPRSIHRYTPPQWGSPAQRSKIARVHVTVLTNSRIARRSKIQHDPNNTAWANNTAGFGHKILAAQGWKPGDYLGAENANHAEHYTAANASHIKVMLREDNLGIGAQVGRGNAETFGLSMFSGLLGRLNGKVEVETEAQQNARRDAVIRIQHDQKYGFLNFVSGGFLIGDKIEKKKPLGAEGSQATAAGKAEASTAGGVKRKWSNKDAAPTATDEVSRGLSQSAKVSESEFSSSDSESETEAIAKPALKPSKKHKNKKGTDAEVKDKDAKRLAKEERRARKEERRKRRAERQIRRAEKEKKKEATKTGQSTALTPAAAPAIAQVPIHMNGSRHATRQRYIQQKRMASMDPKALKEIFMLQAAS